MKGTWYKVPCYGKSTVIINDIYLFTYLIKWGSIATKLERSRPISNWPWWNLWVKDLWPNKLDGVGYDYTNCTDFLFMPCNSKSAVMKVLCDSLFISGIHGTNHNLDKQRQHWRHSNHIFWKFRAAVCLSAPKWGRWRFRFVWQEKIEILFFIVRKTPSTPFKCGQTNSSEWKAHWCIWNLQQTRGSFHWLYSFCYNLLQHKLYGFFSKSFGILWWNC